MPRAIAIQEILVQKSPDDIKFQSSLARTYNNAAIVQEAIGQPAAALGSYERAIAIREKLVEQNRDIVESLGNLATTYKNLAVLHSEAKRPAEALRWHEMARPLQHKLAEQDPNNPRYQSDLGATWGDIGRQLAKLDRFEEAVKAYQQAIQHQRLASDKAPQVPRHRELLSLSYQDLANEQRRLSRPADAAATALELRKLWPKNPTELYNVACEVTRCIPLVGKDKTNLTAEEQAERQKYADQALEVLREAIGSGFKDVEHMKKDTALDSLREREDFNKLITELEKLPQPGAK